MALNLMIPSVAFHFMDVETDDVVCEILEDFGEEEEEDGETTEGMEDSVFFRDFCSVQVMSEALSSVSEDSYPENNAFIHIIELEVQTPPPEYTMC